MSTALDSPRLILGASGSTPDRVYWIVRTANGTTYQLGYATDSAMGQSMAYGLIDTFASCLLPVWILFDLCLGTMRLQPREPSILA